MTISTQLRNQGAPAADRPFPAGRVRRVLQSSCAAAAVHRRTGGTHRHRDQHEGGGIGGARTRGKLDGSRGLHQSLLPGDLHAACDPVRDARAAVARLVGGAGVCGPMRAGPASVADRMRASAWSGNTAPACFCKAWASTSDYARAVCSWKPSAGVLLLVVVIPRWGIVGAAWVTAALTVVNRGFVASWLVSRTVGVSFARYVRSVYAAPICRDAACAGVVVLAAVGDSSGQRLASDGRARGVTVRQLLRSGVLRDAGAQRIARCSCSDWIMNCWRQPAREAVAHG